MKKSYSKLKWNSSWFFIFLIFPHPAKKFVSMFDKDISCSDTGLYRKLLADGFSRDEISRILIDLLIASVDTVRDRRDETRSDSAFFQFRFFPSFFSHLSCATVSKCKFIYASSHRQGYRSSREVWMNIKNNIIKKTFNNWKREIW